MTTKPHSDIHWKFNGLNYSNEIGNIIKVRRYLGISRETFYQWKRTSEVHGETGLINNYPFTLNLWTLLIYLHQPILTR